VDIGFESQDDRKSLLPPFECARNLGLPSRELRFLVFLHIVASEARIAGRILKELREDQLRCIDSGVSQDGKYMFGLDFTLKPLKPCMVHSVLSSLGFRREQQ